MYPTAKKDRSLGGRIEVVQLNVPICKQTIKGGRTEVFECPISCKLQGLQEMRTAVNRIWVYDMV